MDNPLPDIARWLQASDTRVHTTEDPSWLSFSAAMSHLSAQVVVIFAADVVHLHLQLPVGAGSRHLTATAEFFHRLNATLHHLVWIIDPDDGSIFCRLNLDLHQRPLDEDLFHRGMLRLLRGVEAITPSLLGVIGGGLVPLVALDQAHAAIDEALERMWRHTSHPPSADGPTPPRGPDPTRN